MLQLPAPHRGRQLRETRPVWMPRRVEEALEQAKTLADYRDNRVFTFLHLFSGPEDILA